MRIKKKMKMKTTELVNQKCNYFENGEGEFGFKNWQWQIDLDRRCVARKERGEI